jgi:cytochrome c oxidase subunit 2
MSLGGRRYSTNCAACHRQDGKGLPPTFPALKGSSFLVSARNNPGELIKLLLKGKGAMPKFTYLTDAEIAALATYVSNSWGNQGRVIQPADVKAARNK